MAFIPSEEEAAGTRPAPLHLRQAVGPAHLMITPGPNRTGSEIKQDGDENYEAERGAGQSKRDIFAQLPIEVKIQPPRSRR